MVSTSIVYSLSSTLSIMQLNSEHKNDYLEITVT